MKNFITTRLTAVVCAAILLNSCGTSQDVSSNRMITKRKYTKGFHVNLNSRNLSSKANTESKTKEIEVFASNEKIELSKRTVEAVQTEVKSNELLANSFNEFTRVPAKEVKTVKKQKNHFSQALNQHSNALLGTEKSVKSSNKEEMSSNYSSIKQLTKKAEKQKKADDNTILLVILCFILPPLAVYMFEGSWTKRCTINLILTLLCGLPGVIHALIVVLR